MSSYLAEQFGIIPIATRVLLLARSQNAVKKQWKVILRYLSLLFSCDKIIKKTSFIKRQTSDTSSDNEWYNEWQRMTTSGTTSGKTSDNEWNRAATNKDEWYNEWQRVVQRETTSDSKWQRVTRNDNEWQ